MRNIRNITILAILFFAIGHTTATAQFEHKVTLNFSLGTIMPVGINEYLTTTYVGHHENTWLYPYIFSNFNMGYSFTGGAQFNINRLFAVGVGVGAERIGSWTYTRSYSFNGERIEDDFLSWSITSDGDLLDKGVNELNLYNFSIGVFPRINMAYGKMFNPYVFVEITFNYTDINYVNNMRDSWINLGGTEASYDEWYNSQTSPWAFKNTPQNSFGLGLYPGFGIDLNVAPSLGIFIHGGYSFISINKSDLEEANLQPENFNTIKIEVGAKFSFLRSRDI